MGSFASTCAVSKLPIEAGDKVRYLLLTQNPYVEESIKCYSTGLWFPRTYPLQAEYNDYGSIENVKHPALQQGFLDGLKIDMIERGWGDNSVHDVAVKKDMNFSEMLEAVWQGRIKVSGNIRNPLMSEVLEGLGKGKKEVEGVPTLSNIEALVCEQGYSIYTGGSYDNAFMVDEEDRASSGRVRIRTAGYSAKLKDLKKLAAAAKKAGFATMLTQGTGSYSDPVDLLIRPMPGTKDYHYRNYNLDDRLLPVTQCIIREDVWQVLVAASGRYKKSHRKEAAKAWKTFSDALVVPEGLKGDSRITQLIAKMDRESSEFGRFFAKDEIPFTVGLGTAFDTVAKNHANVSEEEKEYFLDSAAEIACVQITLANSRHMWQSTYANGPQFGEWKLHAKLLKGFEEIALKEGAGRDYEDNS
jgi:hypothetical protein